MFLELIKQLGKIFELARTCETVLHHSMFLFDIQCFKSSELSTLQSRDNGICTLQILAPYLPALNVRVKNN